MKEHPPKLETGWVYGAEIGEDEPIVKTALGVAGELGIAPKLVGMGSLTDAIHLINYSKVPTISIGPNDKTCHSIDEFVDIGELINLTRILALSTMRWCGCA